MIRSSAVAAALLWAFSGSAASVVQQEEVEDLNDCVREGPDAYCLMEAFGEAAELLSSESGKLRMHCSMRFAPEPNDPACRSRS